jgi:methionyl-tRNA synthetase
MAEKLLVTCALPYVNNVPHLGNMIPILSADTYTRFLKMTGQDAIYICATDEHGTRTEIEAKRAGLSPEKWCDRMHAAILENFTWFNVKFDYFGKTSSPSNHRITQDIYRHLEKNGYILEEETDLSPFISPL